MPTNPFGYMTPYMREYRKGRRRGRSRLHLSVAAKVTRCPSCTILSPTICRQCEIEGITEARIVLLRFRELFVPWMR